MTAKAAHSRGLTALWWEWLPNTALVLGTAADAVADLGASPPDSAVVVVVVVGMGTVPPEECEMAFVAESSLCSENGLGE